MGDSFEWMDDWGGGDIHDSQPLRASQARDLGLHERVRELDHRVRRLALMNQALWELLRDKARLTDEDLKRMAEEIDLRDGVKDGAITETPLRCPSCSRVSNSKHYKCLYCGELFEKPLFG